MARLRKFKPCILVTAGATRAYLDDVRYISNYSTGELGFLLCEKLKISGMDVVAIVGATHFDFKKLKLRSLIEVETPEEMRKAALQQSRKHRPTYGVFAAAVLDFVPKRTLKGKVSSKSSWKITLVPTPKIIDEVGKAYPKMKKIGFKLESKKLSGSKLETFALKIMKEKKLSGLCVNFFSDVRKTHPASYFGPTGRLTRLNGKAEIAAWIASQIVTPNR